MVRFDQYASPLGPLLLVCEAGSLTGISMNASPQPGWVRDPSDPVLVLTARWLDAYFAGQNPPRNLPLAPVGTDFQRRVWQRLSEIPYGEVITYGDIARQLEREGGKRMSAQAIGGAVGRNPIGIVIPCHRVVGAGGKLTGYAWGLDGKQWLLCHEGWKGMESNDHK